MRPLAILLSTVLPLAVTSGLQAQGNIPTRPPGQQQPGGPAPATKNAGTAEAPATKQVPTRPPGQQQPGNTVPDPDAGKGSSPDAVETKAVTEAKVSVESEADFVKLASSAGMNEVALAKLAQSKAHNKKVKDLAAQLVKDHSAANKNLKAVAEDLKVPESAPDDAHKAKHEALAARKGPDFDAAFVEEMKICHQNDIVLFETARNALKSPLITSYIDKTLPVIKGHAEKLAEFAVGVPTKQDGEPPAEETKRAVKSGDTTPPSDDVPGAARQ